MEMVTRLRYKYPGNSLVLLVLIWFPRRLIDDAPAKKPDKNGVAECVSSALDASRRARISAVHAEKKNGLIRRES